MSAPWKQKASTGGTGSFECAPEGSHPAVCVGLIDLGTHSEEFKDEKTGGKKTLSYRKVLFCWELTAEPMAGFKGRNFIVSKDYRVTFTEKAGLRKMIEAWAGKTFAEGQDFDLEKLLGKKFLISLTHHTSSKDKTYAKIAGVSAVPKGLPVPEPKTKQLLWSIDDGKAPPVDWIPYLYGEKVEEVIARCEERKGHSERPITDEGEVGDANEERELVRIVSKDVGTIEEDIPF
jgi:hypothetical protein